MRVPQSYWMFCISMNPLKTLFILQDKKKWSIDTRFHHLGSQTLTNIFAVADFYNDKSLMIRKGWLGKKLDSLIDKAWIPLREKHICHKPITEFRDFTGTSSTHTVLKLSCISS